MFAKCITCLECNHGENLGSTSAMVGRIDWDRVKVSENLGVTAVAQVAPADTSLHVIKFWPQF